jgi:hypothetical protein
MNYRRRIPNRWLPLLEAGIGIAIVAATANLRLAAVAGAASAAVWGTRVRYSSFAAIALLAAVGCFAALSPGR